MTTVTDFQNILDTNIAANNAAYEKEQKRLESLFKECNSSIPPNVDVDGRYHAPIDGYVCPFDTIENKTYRKGQYLPLPKDLIELLEELNPSYDVMQYDKLGLKKEKILIPASLAGELIKITTKYPYHIHINISTGKTFTRNNVESCYIYITTKRISILKDAFKCIYNMVNNKEQEKKEEEKAQKGIAPTGKQSITGVIKAAYWKDNYFGGSYKMIVELDNKATIWGSIPRKAIDSVDDIKELKDKNISFTATFEHAEDDNTHSFYKRPSKVII